MGNSSNVLDLVRTHGGIASIPEKELQNMGFERRTAGGSVRLHRIDAPPLVPGPPKRRVFGNRRQRVSQEKKQQVAGATSIPRALRVLRGDSEVPSSDETSDVELEGDDALPMIAPEGDPDSYDDQDLAEPDDVPHAPETDAIDGYESCLAFARTCFHYVVGPKELGKILRAGDWYETSGLKEAAIPDQDTIGDLALGLRVTLNKPKGLVPAILYPLSVGEELSGPMGIPWLMDRLQQKGRDRTTPSLHCQPLPAAPLPRGEALADLEVPTFPIRAAAKLFAHALKYRQKEEVELVVDEVSGNLIGLFFDGMTVHPRPVEDATHYVES